MKRLLVAYASRHGSTEEVAHEIASTLRRGGLEVDVCDSENVAGLSEYGAVVLGGALYTGRWHRGARSFVGRHREALAEMPFAVFALGPPSMEKADDSRAQLQRALDHAHVTPDAVAIFGGVIDPAKLRFPFNRMPARDERDWPAIERWAVTLLQLVEREPAAVT
jgi:menaquinone-dependent protoporphyrinogen oxidase